jgi:antitoxin HicB
MPWIYGVQINEDEAGDHVVAVRDLPEVQTSGDTRVEALGLATDAIKVAVASRMRHGEELDAPGRVAPGEVAIALELRLAAKATIYVLWRRKGISKSELGRLMRRSETEARRVLDPDHGTKLDQIADAARALGATLTIAVVPDAA